MKIDIQGIYSNSEEIISDEQLLGYLLDIEKDVNNNFHFEAVTLETLSESIGYFEEINEKSYVSLLRNELKVNSETKDLESSQVLYA